MLDLSGTVFEPHYNDIRVYTNFFAKCETLRSF